jgi:hypothetical protein
MASAACSQISLSASWRPWAPVPTGKVMSMVRARHLRYSVSLMACICSSVRMGWLTTSRCACSAPTDSRFASGPTGHTSDMTISSRIGSIGGFVTCQGRAHTHTHRDTHTGVSSTSRGSQHAYGGGQH